MAEAIAYGMLSLMKMIEGASKEHGRRDSIWDAFAHAKGLVKDKEKGYEGVRHCEKWKDDVKLMKKMGLHAYRFSISWSRIISNGNKDETPNEEGIKFYSDLIDELKANTLEEKYGGFRNSQIIEDFAYYADVCFKNFGNRVKHWITLNEPWTFSYGGYAIGRFAPGRGFDLGKQTMDLIPPSRCKGSIISETCDSDPIIGDPATEPYIVTHNQLLAHATAVKLYRENYKKNQEGIIGISLVSVWTIPLNPEEHKDVKAAQRAIDYMFGWFMDPLKFGHYPEASKSWLYVYPQGLKDLLLYIKAKYDNPLIYITENGYLEEDNPTQSLKDALNDPDRIMYIHDHILRIKETVDESKANVKGYIAWSLMDNFEWDEGFKTLRPLLC
ncbi:hypothetical protein LguiB_009080 [Lonicera macranthoides]